MCVSKIVIILPPVTAKPPCTEIVYLSFIAEGFTTALCAANT